ncbi:MAG: heme-binding protein [Hyphomicrobium sp.]
MTTLRLGSALAAVAAAAMISPAFAVDEQPAATPYPLDAIPEKLPFAEPYGLPISVTTAQRLLQEAASEATKHGWPLSVAVVDSGGTLVAFLRMDGANLASADIAIAKAISAVKFRRPTKVFEEAIQKKSFNYLTTLPSIVASRGGIPLLDKGAVVGAIGCSGGTGSQDEAVCAAAVASLSR